MMNRNGEMAQLMIAEAKGGKEQWQFKYDG